MGASSRQSVRRAILPLLYFTIFFFPGPPEGYGANLGTVVPVVGQVVDLVHDPLRNLVYLANTSRHRVDVYSVASGQLTANIPAGTQPASMALSRDGNTLYVANVGSFTISAIDLTLQQSVLEYYVGSRPDGIAVGADDQILILGTVGLQRLNPADGKITSVTISPPATPPAGLPITPTSPTPAGFLAGLVATPSGDTIIGLSTSRLFVYDVASGTVIRSRNVSGLRAILSVAPDGSRFMAGPFLFDTQTLAILGRTGTVSTTLTGGSVFSADGKSVYATFSTQSPIHPLNSNNPQNAGGATIPGAISGQTPTVITRGVLQSLRSTSLAPQLGLRLAETVISKIILSSDGQYLFANCSSGIQVLPIGQLSKLPVLETDAGNVILSVDPCNRTVATATVRIRNAGGGRMTVAATPNIQAAPIVLRNQPGTTTTTLTITFDPRNVTTLSTLQYVVILVSPEAVNIEPAILVNLSYRDVVQRGTVVPMSGVGVDLVPDTARQLLYIANYTQDQVEVFSMKTLSFSSAIPVGNRPRSMAMPNPDTLVVANGGAETVSVINLNTRKEVAQIAMGPIPMNATPIFPLSIAASSNAILFTAVPLSASGVVPGSGSMWQLSLATQTAYPRLNLGSGVNNVVNGRNLLIAPADGSSILSIEGNGNLRLYDPILDAFPVAAAGAVSGLRGTAAATGDGSYFIIDNSIFNSALQLQGTIVSSSGGQAFGVTTSGNSLVRVQAAATSSTVQSLQNYSSPTRLDIQVALPEPIMDISPAQIGTATGTRQWPPRPTALELGVSSATTLLRQGLVVDNNSNTYALTYSGLSVVSLKASTGKVPSFTAGGVINSASGTTSLSPGCLVSIKGTNLADLDEGSGSPLPRQLGGVCVTANEVTIPLIKTSPTQIDAQLPPELAVGRITLTIRSPKLGLASSGAQVTLRATSPGVFSLDLDNEKRAALFHSSDYNLVIPDYPADRDEELILYATGLGPVTPSVAAGLAASDDPLSTTVNPVSVLIGGYAYQVLWSGLAPGRVGVYQINLYVPGGRVQGSDLPVVVTAGGISSPTGSAPLAAVR